MIKIKVLDEASFIDAKNLDKHYVKHVLSTRYPKTRLDYMSKDEYNELATELSGAECGDPDEGTGVIGFDQGNGKHGKYDYDSKMFTVYDPERDASVTLFKMGYGQIEDYFDDLEDKNGSIKPLPDEEKEGDQFSYDYFVGQHNDVIKRDLLDNIANNLETVGVKLADGTGKKCMALFSKDNDAKLKPVGAPKGKIFNVAKANEINLYDGPKGEDPIDQKSLVLNYIGRTETIKITAKYDTPTLKAFKVEFEPGGYFKRIQNVKNVIMIVAKSGKVNVNNLKAEDFEELSTPATAEATLYYVVSGDPNIHTQLEW